MPTELTGAQLRAWRRAHGWTSITLGMRVGYSESAIRYYERGEQAIPALIVAYVQAHPAPEALPRFIGRRRA